MADALHAVVSTVQAAADEAGVAFLASDIDEDGGKIILVSGVPRAQADHEGRLLRALRSIADADLPLPLQIGVNDGHVFAGTIGATHRATFTVMGDTVNLAARLMSAAPAGRDLRDRRASSTGRGRSSPTRTLEPFSVKGKAQPVQAYAVDEEVGDRATARPRRALRRAASGAAGADAGAAAAPRRRRTRRSSPSSATPAWGRAGWSPRRSSATGVQRVHRARRAGRHHQPVPRLPRRARGPSSGIERADQATMAAAAGGRRRPRSTPRCSRCSRSSAPSPTSRRR